MGEEGEGEDSEMMPLSPMIDVYRRDRERGRGESDVRVIEMRILFR